MIHALLTPSNNAWINYSEEQLIEKARTVKASLYGTELHNLAKVAIQNGCKLASDNVGLNEFVEHAILIGATPEYPVYYSEYCFGTCDALAFKNNTLYIFDLKTGKNKCAENQLLIYDAIYCLQNKKDPKKINHCLIYYYPEKKHILESVSDKVVVVMDIIKKANKIIEEELSHG